MARVFKTRMILYAAYGHCIIREDGSYYEHPHWFELAKDKWAQVYKTTGTPCSCWMCRGFEYDRKEYKKETLRIIRESMEQFKGTEQELNLCHYAHRFSFLLFVQGKTLSKIKTTTDIQNKYLVMYHKIPNHNPIRYQ